MIELFKNGGVPMFGVVLCGLVALVAAVRFSISPDRRKIGAIVSLSLAALASTLLGFASDVMAVCMHVPNHPEWSKPEELPKVLVMGLGEAISPLILGFALLTVIWLVMAVGYRRLAPRLAA